MAKIGFSMWGMMESTYDEFVKWRIVALAVLVIISNLVMIERLLKAERDPSNYRRVSTLLRITKGAGGLTMLILCQAFGWDNILVVWLYLIVCLLDTVRHNAVLLSLLQENFHILSEYVLIMLAVHYVCSVFVFQDPALAMIAKLTHRINTLGNAMLMNVQIMGFEEWGELAKSTF